ncbi:RING-type E3 ubiquitin transferase [Malassezia sp. CBS 17886]|nr:RING-type E3 ubiquitin transferase [Malassezia sp. CBS 17886]
MARRSGATPSHGSSYGGTPQSVPHADYGMAKAESRTQDAYWSDDNDDNECPLCLEEIDISDANFKPCPCGYRICRFCWHHIKQNLNGRCPACRRKYSDQAIEFKAMTTEEIMHLTNAKKSKDREKKEMEATNRKHLANMRVVQKNLVYVVGLSPKFAREEVRMSLRTLTGQFIPTLKSAEYFGQYGRVAKILISKRMSSHKFAHGSHDPSIGVYVTYQNKEDAARAIVAIDGSKEPGGRIIRASYGTTKYCTAYLRNLPCSNPGCTYLHEPGEEADSFTKEDLATLRHAAKDTEHKIKPASMHLTPIVKKPGSSAHADPPEVSALPRTALWASGRPGGDAPPMPLPRPPECALGPAGLPGAAPPSMHSAQEDVPAAAHSPPPAPHAAQPGGEEKDEDVGHADDHTAPPTASTLSTYKPSRNAQQLIDDLHRRRQEASEQPLDFPDFDWTLATFRDGDFSFHLPITQQPAETGTASDATATQGIASLALDAPGPFPLPMFSDEKAPPFSTGYQGLFNPFDADMGDEWVRPPAPTPMRVPAAAPAAVYRESPTPVHDVPREAAPGMLWHLAQQGRVAMPAHASGRGDAWEGREPRDVEHGPEEQRSAAAAMLAARARQLQEASGNTTLHKGDDVRSKLARQQQQTQASGGDSQSLLALLRRIQEAPQEGMGVPDTTRRRPMPAAPPGVAPAAARMSATPPGADPAQRAAMNGAHVHDGAGGTPIVPRTQNWDAGTLYPGSSAPPPGPAMGMAPTTAKPNVATGLLLAQLLGTPSKRVDSYASTPVPHAST